MTTLEYARGYAGLGWQSFPCMPRDKKPMVKWADLATTEDNMLCGWYDNDYAANIGIACGKRSGIVVLDVDAGHDGFETLGILLERHGALPNTPVVRTGSGGEHIYFKHPGIDIRNSAGKLGKGLDIRGDGGYVVAPPSIHPNGNKYEWSIKPSAVSLADMPAWMIEALQEKNEIAEGPNSGEYVSGERNNALTQVAGSMRRKGHSEDGIFAALEIYNAEKCKPPLDKSELLLIARSVARYEPGDAPIVVRALPAAYDVIDQIEAEARERQKNPCDVWGIHYAWDFISLITGGKQKGELIITAGEPGVGKSWWAHQDALFTAVGSPSKNIPSTPVLLWSGEMSRKQVHRRFFDMLGVPKRNLVSGRMSEEDWGRFDDARAIVMNSPIYVSDAPLDLKQVRGMLEREIGEHGIEQVVFDYDWLISAPGASEIEQSQNISRMLKQLARELNVAVILISSVNKTGMDSVSENVTKSAVSGSGKKLHDADVIYIMTKFNEKKNSDLGIMPIDYNKIVTLHISKGRELDYHVPNGAINYMRESPNPKFREMKDVSKINNKIIY
jgi:KaiC/GvpD/RAD55 family RecA-like ATPase